ncbi:Cupredoxin [Cynara cardunculus var. scolymus]|uniref:Cupredoxin n=1 Tax=Cynara cardunculus var. scolymus TaxID=59895 RepID=A0A103XS14_CYNCS|nr:Cupredoxin [Cynara cardunculus var. scolymus]
MTNNTKNVISNSAPTIYPTILHGTPYEADNKPRFAVFKYKKGSDSVLVVDEEAYHNCNKTNPKQTLDDGNSVFKFTRSGPFFFISGHDDKCENGEKLIIVVLAVRNRRNIVNCDAAPPTPPPTKTPAAVAPSTMAQGTDKPTTNAPAPSTSAVASVFGGSIELILGLGLVLSIGI